MKIWERNATAGIRQWDNYVNDGEYLFLAIQGQIESSLWYQTKDDNGFTVVQASKCTIELIILLKDRCTGTAAGVSKPLVYIKQVEKPVVYAQSPPRGGLTSIGDYKRVVEAHVVTTCRLGG